MEAESTHFVGGGPVDGAETEITYKVKKIPARDDPKWEYHYNLEATEYGLRYVFDGFWNKLTGEKWDPQAEA